MATQDELKRLALHWSPIIKGIHPTIDVVVKGDADSVESLLSVWDTGNPSFARPTEAQLLAALSDVETDIQAEQQAEQTRTTNSDDVKTRFRNSPLANRSPQEIYTAMQNQIDGWSSLAEAQADLREWLPLMAAAIAWLVMED